MNVYCQMVKTTISETLCSEEQGAKLCSGCQAPSRRCVSCKGHAELVYPREGLCAACGEKRGVQPSNRKGVSVAEALEDKIDALRQISEHETEISAPVETQASRDRHEILQPPKVLSQTDQILSILGEHAETDRASVRYVKNAKRILMVRARLLPEEAEQALEHLAAKGICRRTDEAIVLLIEASASKKDERVVVSTVDIQVTPVEPKPLLESRPSATEKASAGINARPLPILTYRNAYEILLKRATVVSGERIVRGAVPLLQVALKLAPTTVIAFLDRLLAKECISQRGGWGAIVLLQTQFEDQTLAEMELQPPVSRPSAPRASHLRVIKGEGKTNGNTSTAVKTGNALPATDMAIAELEQRLDSLREVRDRVSVHVATLENYLATLRACRSQLTQEGSLDRLLRESEEAVTALLHTLRK